MLRKTMILLATATTFMVWEGTGSAEELVREFHGSGNTVTAEFDVMGPWLLDWRVNGEYPQLMAIDVVLVDGRTGRHIGLIIHTKRRGNGVKLFNDSGRFKLRVDATLTEWDFKVIQITPAEAEAYTPRKKN